MNRILIHCLVLVLAMLPAHFAMTQTLGPPPTKAQLQRWLKQYPQADTNGDGVLSVQEAKTYRQHLQARKPDTNPHARPTYHFKVDFPFATMSDGVKIALAVGFPKDYDPANAAHKWPAVLNMMGYPGSVEPEPPEHFGNKYVTVRASLRGAGASGGMIQPISRRNGLDGYEIIENWIVKQPWSNGRVALHGHSWGGLTGFMIAATAPPHLKAVAVSGLLDDVYRDIGYIGGIRNAGFPIDWMNQLYLPTGPFESGRAAMLVRGMSRAEYRKIVAARPPIDYSKTLFWQLLTSKEIPAAARDASPGTFAHGVRAPIHIMHAWQDEQTGPSGVWLWKYISDDVPKRLVLSNGNHAMVGRFSSERLQWLNYWTLGEKPKTASDFTDRAHRVRVYFGTKPDSTPLSPPLETSNFPLPNTRWQRFYFAAGGRLAKSPPTASAAATEPGDRYQVVPGVPDKKISRVSYQYAFDHPAALCGPIAVSLWAKCSTIDTDFFVVLADVDPAGHVEFLQRGLLRASHRQLDETLSMWTTVGGKKVLIRPRHTHRNLTPLVPNKPYRFDIEVFPVGHVFGPGHRLVLSISQPPVADPVVHSQHGGPSYLYDSVPPRSVVTILRTDAHASSVLLPLLPHVPQ